MDAEQAAALRKPFGPKAVGKLPKGGVMLDYVGHASVTDRLLAVDPEWNWEPVAYDMSGLPMLDANHNLWIKLTICGVTRFGVGDGKSLKECVGDAIRNSAMRFGVALDLWSKEELEGADGPVFKATAEPVAPPATRTMSRKKPAAKHPLPAAAVEVPDPPEHKLIDSHGNQMKALHAGLNAAGMGDRESALAFLSDVTDRPVESSKDLTVVEAGRVLDELQRMAEGRPFAQEPPDEEAS